MTFAQTSAITKTIIAKVVSGKAIIAKFIVANAISAKAVIAKVIIAKVISAKAITAKVIVANAISAKAVIAKVMTKLTISKWHCVVMVLVVLAQANAQQRLMVNGREVPSLTTNLVVGTAYADALRYAQALGAEFSYDVDGQIVSLQLAERIVTIDVQTSPEIAAQDTDALRLGGQVVPGLAAVDAAGIVYLPVKVVAEALGGRVDYLAELNTVVVVFPRAEVRSVVLEPASGYDRIVIELSQSVPIETRRLPALDAVQFRFLRTDLAQEQQLAGQYVRSGTVASRSGHVDVRLSLAPDSEVDIFTSQQNGLTVAVIDVFREGEQVSASLEQPLRITLDPGHGGRQDGLALAGTNEAALTLEAAQNLALALRRRGHEVRLTREDGVSLPASERANAGLGQDLLLSLHAADVPANSINVFYLGDAETVQGLDYALFENAETVQRLNTDAVRRQVLLNLIPDVGLGERYARNLSRTLAQNYGLRTVALEPLPLTVLAGAAGRGVLLEASATDLRSAAFAENLAAVLEQVVLETRIP